MSKEQFEQLTGEDPVDILGENWEECIDDYLEDSEHFHDGHLRGSCWWCKMD